jgi:hypothetical protein
LTRLRHTQSALARLALVGTLAAGTVAMAAGVAGADDPELGAAMVPSPLNVVGVGNSFGAGFGGTTGVTGSPANRAATALGATSVTNLSQSGATIDDPDLFGGPTQIIDQVTGISSSPQLLVVEGGVNDLKWIFDLVGCVGAAQATCPGGTFGISSGDLTATYNGELFQTRLQRLYQAARSEIASNGLVVVLGYPTTPLNTTGCDNISDGQIATVNAAFAALDTMSRNAVTAVAAANGNQGRIVYVPWTNGDGNDPPKACGGTVNGQGIWWESFSGSPGTSYHPTDLGFAEAGRNIASAVTAFYAPPATTTTTTTTTTTPPPTGGGSGGYWLADRDGRVYQFGSALDFGDRTTSDGTPITDITATTNGAGFWLLSAAGNVEGKGNAPSGGGPAGQLRSNERAVALAARGSGYVVVTSLGRCFGFSGATCPADVRELGLNQPMIDASSTGAGMYMVAEDGGVFAWGGALFLGSTGSIVLNQPVRSLVPDPDGRGYWMVATDGGVFAYDAPFVGSLPAIVPNLNAPVIGLAPSGAGYYMVASDGGVFAFGGAQFAGSLGGTAIPAPIVGIAPVR